MPEQITYWFEYLDENDEAHSEGVEGYSNALAKLVELSERHLADALVFVESDTEPSGAELVGQTTYDDESDIWGYSLQARDC
ncbi:MAG: hypothetical protein HXX08_11305 [Chloroflexi bacterium]|uniref:Uncharacterized protein n=1 Tax=Candidatus Chlorohelix allophototropha TaxID=3003348 RepID=A0A8T7M3D7_9CHLR|nr:hypothetical protein [Chloroflexota bacterium]WJW65824.1 hypothetical protein OZ401_001603 [Chloroflexota bacterium L227-S17]